MASVCLLPARVPLRRCAAAAASCFGASRHFSSRQGLQKAYGFIGCGRMGHPMAVNLRSKLLDGDTLLINDRSKEAVTGVLEEISAAGKGTAEAASSPREVAERSDVIITALPDPAAVTACFDGISPSTLPKSPSNIQRLFIDTSTIDPLTSRKVAASIFEAGVGRLVDAPMSGGVVGARAATLTFMLGAASDAPEIVEQATAVLQMIGKRVMHLGDQGAGLAGKLANNYLLAISNIATAEAMNLGVKLGLDPRVLSELVNTSSGRCWSSEINNPVPGVVDGAPAGKDYAPGFGVALMLKDLRLAKAAAGEADARLELVQEAERLYQEVAEKEPGKDFSVVYRWLGSV